MKNSDAAIRFSDQNSNQKSKNLSTDQFYFSLLTLRNLAEKQFFKKSIQLLILLFLIAGFLINHTGGGGGGITIGEADFLLRLLLVLTEIVFCCSFSILSLGETECRIFDLRSLSVFWSALNAREKVFKVILLTLGCNYKIFLWFTHFEFYI